MAKKDFNDVMDMLKKIPGTEDHLSKFSVIMGKKILKRRLDLGMTQSQVVQQVEKNGEKITQATLSKVESGDDSVKAITYDKVLKALGGLEDLTPEFRGRPKSRQLVKK